MSTRVPIPLLEFISSLWEYFMSIAAATFDGNLDCTDFVACAFPAKDSMKNISYPSHDGSVILFNLKV